MDRGLQGAPAACTLLLLGIWLQLYPGAAEVVHFGPLFLQVNENSNLSINASLPEELVDVFPVNNTLAEPASSAAMTPQHLDSVTSVEPTNTAWPLSSEAVLQDDVLLMPSLTSQLPLSLATTQDLHNSMKTEVSDIIELSSNVMETSTAIQVIPLSVVLESSLYNQFHFVSEESTIVPQLESISGLTQVHWSTKIFPSSAEYSEVSSTDYGIQSSVVESSSSGQISTFSHFDSTVEGTLVVSSSPEASLTDQSSILESSMEMTSMAITEDATSIATKNPLYTMFSNLGLITAYDSTTSPSVTLLMTPLPISSVVNEVSQSEVPDVSESLLVGSKDSTLSLVESPVPTVISQYEQTLVMPSSTLSSDFMYTLWWSEDYLETISIKPSGSMEVRPTSVVSDKEFLVESTIEVVDSVYSSVPVVPLTSSYMYILNSPMDSTGLVDSSLTEMQMATVFPSQSLDLETHLTSLVDSTSLSPSLTELLVSSMPSVELGSTFTTPSIPIWTPFLDSSVFESMNTKEAPAYVLTESGMYFTQTVSPVVDVSEEMSSLASSYLSVATTPDLSSMFSSLPEDFPLTSSSDLSELAPQNFSSMLAISQSMFSSSMLEIHFTTLVETVSGEVMPWHTSNATSLFSFTPSSSADWTERSSSVFSESSKIWEGTPTMQSELDLLYTSSFSGATTLLPLLSSTLLSAATPSLPTYSFDSDHTSSASIEQILQTSMLTMGPLPTELPMSMSTSVLDTLEAYTLLFSVNTLLTGGISPVPSLSATSTISLPLTISLQSTLNLLSTMNFTATLSSPSTLNFLSTTISPSTVSLPVSLSTQPTQTLLSTLTFSHTPSSSLSSSTTHPTTVIATTFIPTTSTSTVSHNTQGTTTSTTAKYVTPEITTTTSPPSVPVTPPSGLTASSSLTTTRPILVCDVSNPEPYLVTTVLSRGSNIENITESIKEILTLHFNRSVELEVYTMSEWFSFMVTSGPVVYTAIAVGNVLTRSALVLGRFPPILSLQTALLGLDQRFYVQTVLQFVPQSVDIRLCTFSEQIQKGLSLALYEVRRLRQESDNFTVQIVNITSSRPPAGIWKAPVTVSYAVRDRNGFMNGSDVSDQLRNLSLVEFSFFLGFPVKQIAEPSTYPQLNLSPLLMDSWLRTILLGVQEQQLRDDAFQTEMERKLAQLIGEATLQKRRWKRASYAGSNAVQVVNISRLDGSDDPVQLVYFIEDQYGRRLTADKASTLVNEVNIQRAAIILGYRLQGAVAQPLNQAQESDRQAQNLWIIVGVAVPVLVVTVIIVILYWKLCRTDKLDFQPDTMSNLQQRQKLQAPSVKGFDFAKQHLGQHSKDEILVVHEPPPPVLHGPLKDSTPSENGDITTPKSKGSAKPSKVGRHRGRVTPSDAGSTASDPSSGKESAEEGSLRPSAPPRETHLRSTAKGEMPVLGMGADQHSSASIFEHVDRMSRSSEASRRLPSKIQLIAMQPMAAPPMHGLSVAEREMEANKINREIQTTLRHKSEIEHHRNKIRLRAKRRGHYEFPLVDVVGMTDTKERQRIYRRAQMQFDKILDPVLGVPAVFIEPRRSSRARRSPKQRRKQQGSSSPPDADRDRLITTDSDGTYKRPPGVSNSAYVSDPDLPSDNPTPVSDLGKYPGSPPHLPPPAQYVAPQPSIEEVRQTMQSLLDDAFALVAPSSQGPGAVQPGSTAGQQPLSSTPARAGRGTTPWGGQYPPHPASHFNRFVEFGAVQASAPSLLTRSPGFGSGFLPPAELPVTESHQADPQYPSRTYQEDILSVARPRPLGSTSGSAQIHQLTQVGIASRMGAQSTELASTRSGQPSGGPGWSSYYHEEEAPRNVHHRDSGNTHGAQDYGTPQMFSMNRGPNRPPPSHLPPSICYPSGSAEDVHLGHSSASLIKAIREELLRLSQKQAVASTYHS
ncbi:UPF0606 protein KIAA1549 homolog isoform X2 [Mixophyes fleayi]|uniref:UPF0606 protein KIAA1549 homolog isoform X2 n=1 Tax=Mixophyes fleayi TaxID=3061075 RepID=UPI003F4D9971